MTTKAEVNYQYFEDALFEKRVWMPSANVSNYLLVFAAPFLGSADKFGRRAFKDLIITLSESEIVPRTIVFWNRAVLACLDRSPLLEALAKIERNGVRILVSAFAIEKLKAKSRLRIGKLANYLDFLEVIHKSQKVVTF
ncbi:MAG: hypothetical protein HQM08_30160 [Candidatus Riflebacteria bacterium]|nr:hypothetical protein [Candidatus Riflebacteria bacterium]